MFERNVLVSFSLIRKATLGFKLINFDANCLAPGSLARDTDANLNPVNNIRMTDSSSDYNEPHLFGF